MIESHFSLGRTRYWKPDGLCGIVPGCRHAFQRRIDQTAVQHRNAPASWISSDVIAERSHLLQRYDDVTLMFVEEINRRLFQELPVHGMTHVLIGIHEAAGKCPFTLERLIEPTNQEDVRRIL